MKKQTKSKPMRPHIARVGVSRQVAIPKKLHDELGLTAGDYIAFERKGHQLVLTPKEFIEKRLAEGLEDIKKGRVSPTFSSAKAALHYLHRQAKELSTTK